MNGHIVGARTSRGWIYWKTHETNISFKNQLMKKVYNDVPLVDCEDIGNIVLPIDIAQELGCSTYTVKNKLGLLLERNLISGKKTSKGWFYWRTEDETMSKLDKILEN